MRAECIKTSSLTWAWNTFPATCPRQHLSKHISPPTATSNVDDDSSSVCSFGSRADITRAGAESVAVPSWIVIGEPVLVMFSGVGSKPGVVRFVGGTEFASGQWVGVSMLKADGRFSILVVVGHSISAVASFRRVAIFD